MARFRYSMQSILDIKLKLETQAKQEFSAARAALDEEERKLQLLFDRKKGYEDEAARLRRGTLNFRDMADNRIAIRCMENFIDDQKVCVKEAERTLERARVKLAEVMIERKTQENLRDKAFEEFLREENRREGKEVDELTSYTYGQKHGAYV